MAKTRIFFATDVHGSDVCFRKFTNAGKFYKATFLILGGDITGKMVVPFIEKSGNTYEIRYHGSTYIADTKDKFERLKKTVSSSGCYPYLTTRDEVEEMRSSEKKFNDVLKRLLLERVHEWIKLAEERLRDTGIKIYMTGGNDDIPEITEVIAKSDYVINPEERVVEIDAMHEMASTGYGNITPWHCPRDIPEEELAKKIEAMMPHIKDMKNAIFNFHVPPINSGLDLCAKLDTSVYPPKPVYKGGREVLIGAGSTAVREAIEKYQPLLGLHGHIHEAKGMHRLGRTLCLNPGSEYGECVLRGVLVMLSDKKPKVDAHLFTSG